jgi:predicted Zn-dependent protease
MKLILTIILFFISISIFSNDDKAVVTFFQGNINVFIEEQKQSVKINLVLPIDARIQLENGSKLDIAYQKKLYSFREEQNTVLKDIFSNTLYKGVTDVKVLGVRALHEQVHTRLMLESQQQFDETVTQAGGSITDYNGWKKPIEACFQKIMSSSGYGLFPLKYAVIQHNDFNAAAYPGGQFIIHTAALDTLDQKTKKDTLKREEALAPIIAHELSHYYNKHSIQSVNRIIVQKDQPAKIAEEDKTLHTIRFEQDQELDADYTGFLLLKKAGYKPNIMIDMLKLLKEITPKTKDGNFTNVFFATHPSANKRLSAFQSSEKELYAFAAKMEDTFSDLDFGRNLDTTLKNLEEGLKLYKDNTLLLKAKAICMHKQWLETTKPEELKLRSIISVPVFQEEQVFSSKPTRAGKKKIPGNLKKYNDAIRAYQKVMDVSSDQMLLSSYSTMLAYSPKKKDEQLAEELSITSIRLSETIQTYNNLAVVHYMIGKHKIALEIVKVLSGQLDNSMKVATIQSVLDPYILEQLKAMQAENSIRTHIDKQYVSPNYTPILNMALLELEIGDSKNGKSTAMNYLKNYDSKSEWSIYLKTMIGE